MSPGKPVKTKIDTRERADREMAVSTLFREPKIDRLVMWMRVLRRGFRDAVCPPFCHASSGSTGRPYMDRIMTNVLLLLAHRLANVASSVGVRTVRGGDFPDSSQNVTRRAVFVTRRHRPSHAVRRCYRLLPRVT